MVLPSFLTYTEIAFVATLLAIALLLLWNVRLEWKLHRFLVQGHPQNLEGILAYLRGKTDDYDGFRKELEKYLTSVEERLRQSVQGMGIVRFNPFKGSGSGGNQSFATAFVNENGNGIVLSTLYARDHVSMYAKPIHHFKSEFELTAEEKEALEKSKEELK